MDRKELLKHIGSVEQIGGIRDFKINDGRAKGVRVIEINTGNLRFSVLPDRCMDIAHAYYRGDSVSWISKTGIVAPTYYEKDGTSWLRSFCGGLVTTCGLKNIGRPVGEYGLHGRIANTPAQKVSVYADWRDEEYIMCVSGEMRENIVFGENLVLKRTITAKLFCDDILLEDTITNEGFSEEKIALCYHCNFGYPLICKNARITNVTEDISYISAPVHGKEEECIDVKYRDDIVTVGIKNRYI